MTINGPQYLSWLKEKFQESHPPFQHLKASLISSRKTDHSSIMMEKVDINAPDGFSENPDGALINISRKPNKCHSWFTFVIKLLVAVLATYGLFSLSNSQTLSEVKTTTEAVVCNCGATVSEAKSKDCKFDSLATAWLPPACRDDGLTAEFERSGPLQNGSWPYYKDLRKEHLLSVDDLAAMAGAEDDSEKTTRGRHADRTYYVTAEWFTARCLFYWRKMERAKTLGTTIERSYLDTSIDGHEISNWHHCSNVYLARIPRDQIAAAGVVGFRDPVA